MDSIEEVYAALKENKSLRYTDMEIVPDLITITLGEDYKIQACEDAVYLLKRKKLFHAKYWKDYWAIYEHWHPGDFQELYDDLVEELSAEAPPWRTVTVIKPRVALLAANLLLAFPVVFLLLIDVINEGVYTQLAPWLSMLMFIAAAACRWDAFHPRLDICDERIICYPWIGKRFSFSASEAEVHIRENVNKGRPTYKYISRSMDGSIAIRVNGRRVVVSAYYENYEALEELLRRCAHIVRVTKNKF